MKSFYDISPPIKILAEVDSFIIIDDGYPVSPGHKLVISKEVYRDYFEIPESAKGQLYKAVELAKELIERDHKPDGYNIGMNCGEAAGQTVFHFHCHVIPRYNGDMENPRGGIRYCIPEKGSY